MSFPTSFPELERAGYTYKGSSNCRKCGIRMLWYATPNGKLMPMNADATPHWASCPNAKDFKRKRHE